MLKIDYGHQSRDVGLEDEVNEEYLIVNGIEDKEGDSYQFNAFNRSAYIVNKTVLDILNNHSFEVISNYLAKYSFKIEVEEWEEDIYLEVFCNDYKDIVSPAIVFNLSFKNWENWKKPYSMGAVAKEVELAITNLQNKKISYWQQQDHSITGGFGAYFKLDNLKMTLNSEVNNVMPFLIDILKKTNRNILSSLNKESVLTFFHFPDELKTACIQYLVYFTQFLADLGIAAEMEVKEELNDTLFKVTPQNRDQGLEQIRDALGIYLNAPAFKNFDLEVESETDIAVQQWKANAYHLKSQLLLAQSIIQTKDSILQAKNATIEMLELSNFQVKQLLEEKMKKESDKEDIIKNIVAVKKYEWKAISVNLPEILRRLKRKFTK